MIYPKSILTGVLLLAILMRAGAQQKLVPGYTVSSIGAKNGLPSSEIFSLHQDKKGFIWIGTNAGLSRYDGYEFQQIKNKNGTYPATVHRITEDAASSTLWLSAENGLYYFAGGELHKIEFSDEENYLPFSDCELNAAGDLYIATALGPACITASQKSSLVRQKNSMGSFILSGWKTFHAIPEKPVKHLAVGPGGEVAIASNYCVYGYKGGHITYIDTLQPGSNYFCKVFIDSSGMMVWGDAQYGIRTLRKGKIQQFWYPLIQDFYGGFDMVSSGDGFDIYSAIGVFHMAAGTNKITPVFTFEKLSIKWPTKMLLDREGNYWLGSHEGLYLLKKNRFTLYPDDTSKAPQEVYSMFESAKHGLLMGTNRGLIYQKEKNRFIPFREAMKVVSRAEVFDIFEDSLQRLWFATGYQGLTVLASNRLANYTQQNGLRDNSNVSFFQTQKGALWTFGDNGITLINSDRNHKVSFENFSLTEKNYLNIRFYNGIEARDGALWLASTKGLFYFKENTLIPFYFSDTGLKNLYAWRIIKSSDGSVWIATNNNGILHCIFNKSNILELKHIYDIKDGLNSNTFMDLVFDNDQNLWASSYKGVSCISTTSKNTFIKNFDANDGFISSDFQNLFLYKDRSGTIWAHGSTGMVSFNPSDLLNFSNGISLYITKIELLNSDVPAHNYAKSVDIANNLPVQLLLPYNNSSVSIHFTAIHFSNPQAVRYFYNLNEDDSSWTEITEGRSISFRRLLPGKYALKIKATTGGNQWSNTASYSFTVSYPFWQKWWFILPAFLSLAGLIIFFVKKREKNIQERETQKTEIEKIRSTSYQHQLEIEKVINFFAHSMSRQKTAEDMLWDVTRNCISKLSFEDCVIYLADEEKNVLVQKAAWGPKTTEENKILNPIEIPIGKGIVGHVALTGKSEIINDTSTDSRYIVDDQQRSAELSVPLFHEGKVIGVIDCEHSVKNFYTAWHMQIIETVAALCADRLEKMKAESESHQKEIRLAELNRNLATSQLTALRAQMNPHFIFNALNSIQQYILTGNVDQANKYLSKFSRLQREVLNHCDQNFITLDKEIGMLQLYLQLEQLRFNDNFDYDVTCDNEIDDTEIRIPPMILQPFVENAIWHGLMPKQGAKEVNIHFTLMGENVLHCIIRDNGIGRLAAMRMKQNNTEPVKHKSKGLGLVLERLKILELQYEQPFRAIMNDITDDGGYVQGTEIKLVLFIAV